MFSKNEWVLIFAIMNGVECRTESLKINIISGMKFEDCSRIIPSEFVEKIESLTDEELGYVEEKISAFWDTSEGYYFATDEKLKKLGLI